MTINKEPYQHIVNSLSIIHSNTYFNELLKVAKMQLSSSRYRPIFLFPVPYPTVQRDINVCIANGIMCLDSEGKKIDTPADEKSVTNNPVDSTPKKSKVIKLFISIITFFQIRLIFDVLYYIKFLKWRISFIEQIIKKHSVSIIIIGGDLVHYDTAAIIKAGHQMGIPTVIVPCTMSNALEMAESYNNDARYSTKKLSNYLVSKKFPEWAYQHNKKTLLRLPAAHALAVILLRLSPPRPWINNSSFADRIAAESISMIEYYTREEIPIQQIILTGSISHDRLSEKLKNPAQYKTEIYKKYGLSPDKPLIVSALPADQHYLVGGRPQCDFKTYPELIDFWVKSLAAISNYNILINLHPSMLYEEYTYIEKLGVTIAREDITDLIPLCDLFVASVSSVIRWAIASGKPVINYDVHKFNYTDYLNVPGIITTQSQKVYQEILRRWTSNTDELSKATDKQRMYAHRWGLLDGKAGERILELFNELTQTSLEKKAGQ